MQQGKKALHVCEEASALKAGIHTLLTGEGEVFVGASTECSTFGAGLDRNGLGPVQCMGQSVGPSIGRDTRVKMHMQKREKREREYS